MFTAMPLQSLIWGRGSVAVGGVVCLDTCIAWGPGTQYFALEFMVYVVTDQLILVLCIFSNLDPTLCLSTKWVKHITHSLVKGSNMLEAPCRIYGSDSFLEASVCQMTTLGLGVSHGKRRMWMWQKIYQGVYLINQPKTKRLNSCSWNIAAHLLLWEKASSYLMTFGVPTPTALHLL